MSELTNNSSVSNGKWRLLASVSAITLTAVFPASVLASDDDKPTVWIEVGGQLERMSNGQERYSPPFVPNLLENPFTPPSKIQRPARYSFGQEGRLSFSPEGSDWTFSAAVRYGRSNGQAQTHEETPRPQSADAILSIPALGRYQRSPVPLPGRRFATTGFQMHDSHLALDFMAGKDVGLGAFGNHGSSSFSGGVRFAQFTSRSSVRIDSDPDFHLTYKYRSTFAGLPAVIKIPRAQWDIYSGKLDVSRSFTGLGPSVSWNANATLLGNPEHATVTFDWGLNGALLFGRQKMQAHHITSAHHGSAAIAVGPLPTLYPAKSYITARSRRVVIPDIGGFAGLSLRFPNAKVSLGYRVDAFFNAIDGGIGARKTYDRDFYGPFATISIGFP